MSARFVLVFVALALVTCGCTKSTHNVDQVPAFPSPPTTEQLIAKAHLDPCPVTPPVAPSSHPLPSLTLPCLGAGPAVNLAALRGTPTVINIWATWCGPCQQETRYLSAVYDAAKPKVRFLGVDTEDSARSALDFARHVTPPMRYPQVSDNDKKLLIALRLPSAVPTTIFVDAAGRIVKILPAPYRSLSTLRADIKRFLGVTV